MPNRILAIRYNNADCLVHLFYTEELLTINILDNKLAEEVGFGSFTIDHEGELINSLSPKHAINTEAALALYYLLLRENAEYLRSIKFGKEHHLAKAG